jgi:UDP-3-O-[3-hydroxymyristoyl] glucosamine N-acyltransferase
VKTLGEYANLLSAELRGDPATPIERIASIDDVDERTITFAVDEVYLRDALSSRAAAVLTERAFADKLTLVRKPLLLVPSTRAALSIVLRTLERPRPVGPFRHPSAVIDPSALVAEDAYIGPLVSIGAGASVGSQTVLLNGVVIGAEARIGTRGLFHPRSMLLDQCIAGDDVVLQAGAVVGSDGFGYVFIDGGFRKIPQVGIVELGDGVEIGANTCIDRAQTGATRIGPGTKIDNLLQIAHNVHIGANCAFAAQTGIAGSTTIGDYVMVGGKTAINGHIRIGSGVKVRGDSQVWRDVPDGVSISGSPAQDHREELRLQVRLKHLNNLFERVDALEKRRNHD